MAVDFISLDPALPAVMILVASVRDWKADKNCGLFLLNFTGHTSHLSPSSNTDTNSQLWKQNKAEFATASYI